MDYIPTAIELPKNVIGICFNVYEAIYLTGIIAADTTQSGKIGVIIGENIPAWNIYAAAFYSGVLAEKIDLEIRGIYVGSAENIDLAQSIANQMYVNKNDILFAGTGEANTGVVKSAKNKDKYVICSDIDLSTNDVPGNVLVSAVKKYDTTAHKLIRKYADGELRGGEMLKLGLKEDGVGILIPNRELPISAETLEKVEAIKEKIIDGTIKIPSDEIELLEIFPEIDFMK
jgi:basic membrane protein A